MSKPTQVVTHIIPKMSDMLPAMDEVINRTSFDEPSDSIADPDVEDDAPGEGDTARDEPKTTRKTDPTIIQL